MVPRPRLQKWIAQLKQREAIAQLAAAHVGRDAAGQSLVMIAQAEVGYIGCARCGTPAGQVGKPIQKDGEFSALEPGQDQLPQKLWGLKIQILLCATCLETVHRFNLLTK